MFLSFLLLIFVQSVRQKIKFCESDEECRPGYYCEFDVPCNWPGHCLGDPCETCRDCDGDLVCYENKCAIYESEREPQPSPEPSPYDPLCTWPGHCLGDQCTTCDDCDRDLICESGKCVNKDRPLPSPEPQPSHNPEQPGEIPITSGNRATLTYFDDNTFECIGQTTPPGFSLAVNPLLLGYTAEFYQNLNGATPPWCGKTITFDVNGKVFIGTIIDTCNPVDSGTFPDPITGEPIGGKCGYDDVIDIYGDVGRDFLLDAVGDDFFQGNVDWILTD